jgi:aspartate/methionine/tyrosine aminotransferase
LDNVGLKENEPMMPLDLEETIRLLRHQCTTKWAQNVMSGQVPPIRGMARLTREAQDLVLQECARRGLSSSESAQVLESAIVDRTIGDVDVRAIREQGFTDLADQIGITIPGEGGARGEQYQRTHQRMQEIELELLRDHHLDLRMYDVFGVGNPVLREQLRGKMIREYGLEFPIEQIFLSLGGINGMDRTIRMLRRLFAKQGLDCVFGFPAPGFAIAQWQAEASGIRVRLIQTAEDASYKLTPPQLHQIFMDEPDLRALYLTVTNNPTAYSYSPEELTALFQVISTDRPELIILADLAYIGTADPAMDYARMQAFADSHIAAQTLFISSLSKTFTLTGDRFGWVAFGNRQIADAMSLGWNNFSAGLPREWQLSFMAHLELMAARPDLTEKIRKLYALRRNRLIAQLHALNQTTRVFDEIGRDEGGGVYNWCKFKPGEDVFSLFEKTGIAGVPGSAFGYSDRFVRFSVGIVPSE